MQQILVIADQEAKDLSAIRKGLEYACITGANLDILSFRHADLGGIHTRGSMEPDEVKGLILRDTKLALQDAIDGLLPQFPSVTQERVSLEVVWDKNMHEQITQRAIDQHYDLLIKTGHRSESPFYTPTDWHLMREAPAPVYLVAEQPWKAKHRVLVALDIESKHAEKQQLNLRLLETGRKLADSLYAELDCCFVVHIPKLLLEFDVVDTSTYTRRAREKFLPRAEEMAKPYGVKPENIYREAGDSAEKILKLTNKLRPVCLVIGSIGRHGVAGKLIGNTAEEVIKSLHTDLLVVNNA